MDPIEGLADEDEVVTLIAMNTRSFDSVLCFGDSDWWYHNRGHADMQFMRRFARRFRTIYVNSLGVHIPSVSEGRMFARRVGRKLKSLARFYRDGGEGFSVLTPVYAPIRSGWAAGAARTALVAQLRTVMSLCGMHRPLIWVACPTAAGVVPRLPRAGVVYQLSDFYGGLFQERPDQLDDTAQSQERSIGELADLVVCSSDALYARAEGWCRSAAYVDHGVDYDLFANGAASALRPEMLSGVTEPIVGFFGNLDGNTVDRALLDEVIRSRPQYRFALVGPMAADFEKLTRHENVIATGQQPYRAIPAFGAAFDVCLMPWLQNDWIKHCNPVKLKEYLALGKPVVTTPFPELARCGNLCYQAQGATAFAAAIDQALSEDNADKQAARREWASRHSWDSKFDLVMTLLQQQGILPDEHAG